MGVHIKMSMFFIAAHENYALIREKRGVPTVASTDKLYCCATPCCQDTKTVKITNNRLKFTMAEISLQDGSNVSVVCKASYSIDTSSSKNILQAYKSFLPTTTQRKTSSSKVNIDDGVKCAIREVVIKYMKPLHKENIDAIDLKFEDSLFEEAKRELRSKKVILKRFQIHEVFSDDTPQSIKEQAGSKKSSINEARNEDGVKVLWFPDDWGLNDNFDSSAQVYESFLDLHLQDL